MAINTTTRQTTAFTSGNNFAFAFKVYEEGDVKVIRITTSTGAEEVLTITTHYTITLNDDQNANPGGTVTLVNSGSPVNLGSGFNVVITSKVTPLQQTEITNQGGFFPEVINDVLDKAAILDQQQQSILDKTIRFPLTQTVGGLEITENAANRAGKVVQFDGSGDLTILGTVDGRDVSADGAKLDTIETNAKDDQTAAEIRTLVESANDSNVFTDADHTKLNGIEAGATADLTASEIKALYEGNSNTNVLSDAQVSKLNGIEAGATGDQSASEIRTLVGSASDSNVFTDNDHSKLDGIETGATADQTSGDIKTLLQSDKLTASELANNSVTVSQIQDSQITAAKLDPATVITASEQASATPNDTSFLTSAAADARFFNVSTGDTIKDGDTFPDNDTTIATTAAINDRIIDLVDDVGGFVPIANETSFPTANPDAENGTGTVVSVKAASTNLTPSGTTVTIANGAGTGNTVTITGVPSVIPSGFGFLVETTTTLHTYTFHRLVPKATEVTTVAGKAVEIGRLGTADAVADMAILGTTDVVADLNMLATTDIVADMALLATTDVIADMALLAVSDVISDMNDLATSANITAMANCSNSISSITNASSNLNSINNFGDKYQIASNDPSTDGGGNALAVGDLYFNTSANELKIYNGSSWQGGVTASGNFASTTGNTFTGDNRYNDGVQALFGTGSDLKIYHHTDNNSYIQNYTGDLFIKSNDDDLVLQAADDILIRPQNGEDGIHLKGNGSVELYYDASKKLETTSYGVLCTEALKLNGNFLELNNSGDVQYTLNKGSTQLFSIRNNSNAGVHINTQNSAILALGVSTGSNNGTVESDLRILAGGLIQIPHDNKKLQIGAGQDLQLLHTGTYSNIYNATGDLDISSDVTRLKNGNRSETFASFINNGQAELYYDNSKKLETTSTGIKVSSPSANPDIKITGALGSGAEHRIFVAGSNSESLQITGNTRLFLNANDINFRDASTTVDLFTITSNGDVNLPRDNKKLQIGASQDLQLYHNGSHSYIQDSGTGGLVLATSQLIVNNAASNEVQMIATENGSVDLYYDNNKKLETVTGGANVTGALGINTTSPASTIDARATSGASITARNTGTVASVAIAVGSSTNQLVSRGANVSTARDLIFMVGSTTATRLDSNGHLRPETDSTFDLGSNAIRWRNLYADTLYGDGSNLTGINTDLVSDTSPQLGGNLDVNGHRILVPDLDVADNVIYIGTGGDLQLYHTSGGDSYIDDTGSGNLLIRGSAVQINKNVSTEKMARFIADGAVELYYDNNKKLETQANGVTVTGRIDMSDNNCQLSQASTSRLRITSGYGYINIGSANSGYVHFETDRAKFYFNKQVEWDGHIMPYANNTYDLGTSSTRWRNVYTNDLNLSNEGGANDVDGTWGSYTIQEGAESLFLINKRNGKKYKFNLTEVS